MLVTAAPPWNDLSVLHPIPSPHPRWFPLSSFSSSSNSPGALPLTPPHLFLSITAGKLFKKQKLNIVGETKAHLTELLTHLLEASLSSNLLFGPLKAFFTSSSLKVLSNGVGEKVHVM